MDFESARIKMIDSQVRPNGITDERLMAAMAAVPRELFVPPGKESLAYMDEDIEIGATPGRGCRRYLVEPMTFARMVQLLSFEPEDIVLDVGCATGYSSAILSMLAKTVICLESDPELAAQASANLAKMGAANARVVEGELGAGFLAGGPYDAICINGRIPEPPLPLLAQLREHGRLATVVGDHELGRVALFTRNGAFSVRYAYDAATQCLPGFDAARPAFAF